MTTERETLTLSGSRDNAPAQERTPREHDSRPSRKSDAWVPPDTLPVPDDRDGFVHRWVRASTLNQVDTANVSKRFREGWEACNVADYPEMKMIFSDIDAKFGKDTIQIGGLMLCKIPKEIVDQRNEYHRKLNASQMESVDHNYMRENDPRMPLLPTKRSSRTTFGRGD
jgi:hypothetical protein